MNEQEKNILKKQLTEFYEKHNPDKVRLVGEIVDYVDKRSNGKTNAHGQINQLNKQLIDKYGVGIDDASQISKRALESSILKDRLIEYFNKHNKSLLQSVEHIIEFTEIDDKKIELLSKKLQETYGEPLLPDSDDAQLLKKKLTNSLTKYFGRYDQSKLKNIDEIVMRVVPHGAYGVDILSKSLLDKYGALIPPIILSKENEIQSSQNKNVDMDARNASVRISMVNNNYINFFIIFIKFYFNKNK